MCVRRHHDANAINGILTPSSVRSVEPSGYVPQSGIFYLPQKTHVEVTPPERACSQRPKLCLGLKVTAETAARLIE